jgi:hypothetical protein
LKYCLGTYRTTTPAPTGEIQQADRLRGTLTWAEHVQRRKRAQWEAEKRQRFAALEPSSAQGDQCERYDVFGDRHGTRA